MPAFLSTISLRSLDTIDFDSSIETSRPRAPSTAIGSFGCITTTSKTAAAVTPKSPEKFFIIRFALGNWRVVFCVYLFICIVLALTRTLCDFRLFGLVGIRRERMK